LKTGVEQERIGGPCKITFADDEKVLMGAQRSRHHPGVQDGTRPLFLVAVLRN
jgi:hypothetical protein